MNDTNDPMDEIHELIWALLDEVATDDQIRRLDQLLVDDEEARKLYLTCMQMHSELFYRFGGMKSKLPPIIEEIRKTPLPIVDLPPITPGGTASVGFTS